MIRNICHTKNSILGMSSFSPFSRRILEIFNSFPRKLNIVATFQKSCLLTTASLLTFDLLAIILDASNGSFHQRLKKVKFQLSTLYRAHINIPPAQLLPRNFTQS